MENLTITRIEFENIGCMQRESLRPAPFTVIYGDNGVGKSTIIRAFRKFFKGGYDPTLVRKLADIGTIRMEFSDGSYGIRTVNTLTRKSTLEMYSKDGSELRPFQETIEEYASGFAFDPMAFLDTTKAKRLEYLEQFIKVTVAKEELIEACGEQDLLRVYNPSLSAFVNIDAISDLAYEQRTAINREASNLRGAVQTIREGIDSLNDESIPWEKHEADTRAAMVAAESELRVVLGRVDEEAKAAGDRYKQEYESAAKAAHLEYENAVKIAAQLRDTQLANAKTRLAEMTTAVSRAQAEAAAKVNVELGVIAADTKARHQAAKEGLDAFNKARGAREQIAKLEEQIKIKGGRADFLTNVLERLKDLRKEKQKSSPIKELEIRNGDIFFDGVEFDAVNKAQQMALMFRIAKFSLGKCPFMIVDEAEHWTEENFAAFRDHALQSGIQVVAARVDNGDLRIEEYGREKAA